jgi:hypothetical protein
MGINPVCAIEKFSEKKIISGSHNTITSRISARSWDK